MSLAEDVLGGDFRALSRAISRVEAGSDEGLQLLDAVASRIGGALRVGITGPPGVGKSTAVDALASLLCDRGEKVAVVAVDPSSPFSGGALLGDRIRLGDKTAGGAVFFRSMATRGAAGGLARATQDAVDLLDASGRTIILIETVGVGQSEIRVATASDVVVVMLSPESGDGVQAMKSGLLEVADMIVINKADRGGADRMESNLRGALELGPASRRELPVLQTVASTGKGMEELLAAMDGFVAARKTSSQFKDRRKTNMERRIKGLSDFLLRRDLWGKNGVAERLSAGASRVLDGSESAHQAARRLIEGLVS